MTNTNRLRDFIRELVLDYGNENRDGISLPWEKLEEDDQTKLVALYIESNDRNGATELFFTNEAELQDVCVSAFLQLLKSDTKDTREDLIETLKKNVLSKENTIQRLQELINTECDNIYVNRMEEHGLTRRMHADNGEIYWSR